jgi:hypothetical protein
MNDCSCPTGRPTPAALALGFCGAALVCLLARELLLSFCSEEAALGAALAVLPLAMAAGLRLSQRGDAHGHPADRLAPYLGLLALAMPLALLLLRAVRPILAPGGALGVPGVSLVVGSALVAFVPLGLILGGGLAVTAQAADRVSQPLRLPLPASLAIGATLGALFVQFVAVPKLLPINASLDLGIGCCAAGVLCAAGAPNSRRMETWLSLLAFAFVLALPLSGIIDGLLAGWAWSCPADAAPSGPSNLASLLTDGLAPVLGAAGPVLLAGIILLWRSGTMAEASRAAYGPFGRGVVDASLLAGLLFAFKALGGDLFGRLSLLVAVYAAGQALALYLPFRREGRQAILAPSQPLFLGYALGLLLPALLLLL